MSVKQPGILKPLAQLIQACIAGDRASQGKLYDFFAPKMFGVCLRYSKSRVEAEEILQEGFIQMFRSLKNFRHEGSFEGWLRKIMVYSAIRHYRTNSNIYRVVPIETVMPDETGVEEISSVLGKKELLKMVQQLPPACRMVFNLYVFEGMKHREIAELLGISEGTSKSNLYDARMILQKAVAGSLRIAK
jgi:RNA polymerase sigma-70 factor (ECF subfamily)